MNVTQQKQLDEIIEMLGKLPNYQEYVRAYNFLLEQEIINKKRHETIVHEGVVSQEVFNRQIDYIKTLRVSDFLSKHFWYTGDPQYFVFEWIPSAYYFCITLHKGFGSDCIDCDRALSNNEYISFEQMKKCEAEYIMRLEKPVEVWRPYKKETRHDALTPEQYIYLLEKQSNLTKGN